MNPLLAREEAGERRMPWSLDSQYTLIGASMERPCLTPERVPSPTDFCFLSLQLKVEILTLCEAILTTSILQFE